MLTNYLNTRTIKTTCLLLFCCWFFGLAPAWAAIDVYQFNNDEHRLRFQNLTNELRCPKCQNQNLADSNAPIAQDLRKKIYGMLAEQRTDQEIVDYMLARYGDFVLYQPRLDSKTYLLWFGPGVLFIIGILVVFFITRKNNFAKDSKLADAGEQVSLDAQQQQRLAELLNDHNEQAS